MAFCSGRSFLLDLCDALGIDGKIEPILKIVIECDAVGVPTIYIKRLILNTQTEKILDFVKEVRDVSVTDKCEVVIKE